MRRLLTALTIMCLAAASHSGTAVAQDASPALGAADRDAIQQTIRRQMDAFQHDDASGAFAFAAPGTQQRFADAATFLEMVRRAYQPVYHPRGVDFTKLSTPDGEVVQSVELIGPDGAAYTALYTMEREADGSWRIIACMLVPSQRVGA
jgi:ketosteroid isomerase-like protein